MRETFKGLLDSVAGFLIRIGLKPNMVTYAGLVGHVAAAFLVLQGRISWAGILLLVMAPLDALDGAMARLLGQPTTFGAFVDSVTDRYSELVIFGGLLFAYLLQQNWVGGTLAYLAAAGSILVSYTRARAESLGFDAKVGVLTRLERYIVLIPSLIFNIPLIGLGIIAVLSNFTALQRILYVRRQAVEKAAGSRKE